MDTWYNSPHHRENVTEPHKNVQFDMVKSLSRSTLAAGTKGAMKILVLLLVATYAGGRPLELGWDGPETGIPELLGGLKFLVSSVVKTIQVTLDIAGKVGNFLSNLNTLVLSKMELGGQITNKLMGELISHTLDLAVDNNIVTRDVAKRILITFNIRTSIGDQPLQPADIDSMHVAGDKDEADEFRATLKGLLQATKTSGSNQLSILAGVENALFDLLAGNSIVKARGVLALKKFFSLNSLISGLKDPVQGVGAVTRFILRLQKQIGGKVQGAQRFLENFKHALEAKAKAAGDFSTGLLIGVVTDTLQLAQKNDLLDVNGVNRLLATFGGILDEHTTLLDSADIDSLFAGNDAAGAKNFKQTLKDLLQLKVDGYATNFALLGGLEAAVLGHMAANYVMKATMVTPMLNKMGLTQVVTLIDSSSKLITDLQGGVVGGVAASSKFTMNFKTAIQLKVKAGGDLTLDVLTKALPAVLNLAMSNKVINADDAARIAASFKVEINPGAKALQITDVDSLSIGGDAKAANEFRETLKALLRVVASGGFGSLVSTLAGLNVAVVDLLATNSIVMASTAMGLKAFLVA